MKLLLAYPRTSAVLLAGLWTAAIVFSVLHPTSQVGAEVTLVSTPTSVAGASKCRVVKVSLDYKNQVLQAEYECTNASGTTTEGGSRSFPFPNPTPAALGNLLLAIEKTLAGHSSGSAGTIGDPPFSGTVTP